ncbi:hypothetical protein ABZ354_25720 [Streptomyces sp. NPDC005925]|uniref:hypothetical protein n=1 Tax=Streptomyces sp. NPDC005925 TaxID=3157172 RepID=UPI0033DE3476
MADGTDAIVVNARGRAPAAGPGGPRRDPGTRLITLVAGLFTAAQLILVRPGLGLGWDETVYVSQVTPDAPDAFFSAPRSRGVTLLVAPVASWSTSTPLLRVCLAVLSGIALGLALRVWRGLFPTRVPAAAGALFATLWVTLFYGPQAMPNLWVAFGALICVGSFLRARSGRTDRAALWGVAGGALLMALMRPMDAVWVTLPLLVLAAAARHWRTLLVLLAGLAAGAAEWVIEAYVSFGGLTERLAEASRAEGGLGWHVAVGDQMRGLGGRALCRPCTGPLPHPAVSLWWFALPVLALLGLAVAIRAGRAGRTAVPLACAGTAAFPYLFMIGFAAPRFLLSAYALLALAVADALRHLVTVVRGRWRTAAVALVAAGLAGHLAVQYVVLAQTVGRNTADREAWTRAAADLRRLGVRPPCLLTGHQAIPLGHYSGCASAATSGNNRNATVAEVRSTARRIPVAHLTVPGGIPAGYARDWTEHRLERLWAYVAPSTRR